MEYELDCLKDDLARHNALIGKMIFDLYHAQRMKRDLEEDISALEYDIENQASA